MEIKKSIVEAFIDSIIIYEISVEIRVKQIPMDMDKVGGDERQHQLEMFIHSPKLGKLRAIK